MAGNASNTGLVPVQMATTYHLQQAQGESISFELLRASYQFCVVFGSLFTPWWRKRADLGLKSRYLRQVPWLSHSLSGHRPLSEAGAFPLSLQRCDSRAYPTPFFIIPRPLADATRTANGSVAVPAAADVPKPLVRAKVVDAFLAILEVSGHQEMHLRDIYAAMKDQIIDNYRVDPRLNWEGKIKEFLTSEQQRHHDTDRPQPPRRVKGEIVARRGQRRRRHLETAAHSVGQTDAPRCAGGRAAAAECPSEGRAGEGRAPD
jgi:hypothetical protein